MLFNTGSSCLGLLLFEFLVFRAGLMFFNTEAPPKLDIFAFTGYKFVACVFVFRSTLSLCSFAKGDS